MATKVLVLALLAASAAATAHGPFSDDFLKHLQKDSEINEYALSSYKTYGADGTFGGRKSSDEKIDKQPVVFVHGNSDSALHHSDTATGWTKSVEHFKAHDYSGAELFGLSYGTRDITNALTSSITCRNVLGTRRFLESVIDYTEAEKIDIVAHSMGVTLARQAIKGGMVHLPGESCDLGDSLADRVDAFVAIAGANWGMCMCLMDGLPEKPACGPAGFGPGTCSGYNASMSVCNDEKSQCTEKLDYSAILKAVNNDEKKDDDDEKEADFVASLWSNDDNILGKDNLVWGRKTSVVPGSDLTHAYEKYDHFQTKDRSFRDQLSLVSKHSLHGGRAKRHH